MIGQPAGDFLPQLEQAQGRRVLPDILSPGPGLCQCPREVFNRKEPLIGRQLGEIGDQINWKRGSHLEGHLQSPAREKGGWIEVQRSRSGTPNDRAAAHAAGQQTLPRELAVGALNRPPVDPENTRELPCCRQSGALLQKTRRYPSLDRRCQLISKRLPRQSVETNSGPVQLAHRLSNCSEPYRQGQWPPGGDPSFL